MKSILDTLSAKRFEITNTDIAIYNGFYDEYKRHGLDANDSRLFANLLFLLTNKSIVDYLLAQLDKDIKKLWHKQSVNGSVVLELHDPDEYLPFVGLMWPVPKPELAENHSNHLLSRVLLQMEQRHNINVTHESGAPVPTFLGVITHEDATKILINQRRLWNDDPRMSGIFFHGKMMHRIQFYLMMKAVDSGLLDVGRLTISGIIKKLVNTKVNAYAPFYDNAWNFMLDFNISDIHFSEIDRRNLAPLSQYFPPAISGNAYEKPYLFGCDPYFLHSYLMTASRANTPYLSECVTQTFCKSAIAIQELERELGVKEKYIGFIDNKLSHHQRTTRAKLTKNDLKMENVLSRQAQTFATYGVHAVRFEHIIAAQKKAGKDKKLDRKRSKPSSSTGLIQYRSMFSTDRPAEVDHHTGETSVKHRKVF